MSARAKLSMPGPYARRHRDDAFTRDLSQSSFVRSVAKRIAGPFRNVGSQTRCLITARCSALATPLATPSCFDIQLHADMIDVMRRAAHFVFALVAGFALLAVLGYISLTYVI